MELQLAVEVDVGLELVAVMAADLDAFVGQFEVDGELAEVFETGLDDDKSLFGP